MSDSKYIAVLRQTRDQYRANAEHAILAREYRKASELLWGALTQQLKILAATHDIVVTRHGQFFDFLRQAAAELKDESIYKEFVELNALHKNFYDEIIPDDVFPGYYERALQYMARLEELAQRMPA